MDLNPPATRAARNNMVDSQVRPNKVTDPRVLDAMRSLPREAFVPADLAALAYVDRPLPLGRGRVLMEPMVIARLVQLTRPRPGDRALVIGAGTGYGAALLAACGASVTALESDDELCSLMVRVLASFAPQTRVVSGPLTQGLPQGGPWTIILIEGAVRAIPPAFAAQLADHGRLVTVLLEGHEDSRNALSHAVLAELVVTQGERRFRPREAFNCGTPTLPGFEAKPAFVF